MDFLSTAIENIRYNLGESAVSENELQHLQYSIMKDATAQYRVFGYDSPHLCSHHATPTIAVTAPQNICPPNAASATSSNPVAVTATNNNNVASSVDRRRSVLLRTSARHLRRRTTSNNINLASSSSRAPNLVTVSPPLSDHMGLALLPPERGGGEQSGEGERGSPPFLLLDKDSGRPTPPVKRRRRHGGVLDNVTPLNGSPMTDGTHS
ncbi:hypothetical protein ACTXT7_006101 [Hymenolepis weldensis]